MGISSTERNRRHRAKKAAAWIEEHGAPKQVGGNRKPKTFRNCEGCGVWYGPLDRLDQKFCSIACKQKWREPNRSGERVTISKARSAQRQVAYHIQTGRLIRPTICEECGQTGRRIEAAHRDYDRPLDVRWLCRPCHVRWDKADPKGATVILARWEKATGKTARLSDG